MIITITGPIKLPHENQRIRAACAGCGAVLECQLCDFTRARTPYGPPAFITCPHCGKVIFEKQTTVVK